MPLRELSNSNGAELTPDRYAQRILVRNLDENGQSGQLPGGQTAKARPGYRVQSLRVGDVATTIFIKAKRHHNRVQDTCLYRCEQLSWILPGFSPVQAVLNLPQLEQK